VSEAIRRLLVAYDVSSDARRDRVAVALQSYGERIQYSVFVVDGKPADFVRLQMALAQLIDSRTDRVLLCDLGSREAAKRKLTYLGRAPYLTGDLSALIV
jgi:CRISPR-associated protein Cas2